MTAIVVDASVALKWLVDEDGSDDAVALARYELTAPDLLKIECANALWAKARRGELNEAEVLERVRALSTVPMSLVSQNDLLEEAVGLALALEHPVYDCLYLALAVRRDAPVVTADRRFVAAVQRHAVHAGRVSLLGEFTGGV